MVCKHPFDLKIISSVLGIDYNKFYRWYKEIFSEFKTLKEQHKLHEHDISGSLNEQGKPYKIRVPMLKPENIGSHMAIDEKHINGRFYTILTNGKTSKVALMIASMNQKEIGKCLIKFGDKLHKVKTLSRDLSNTFHSIGNKYFPSAIQVADKYHVIAQGIDSLQDIRIRLKQKEQKNERIKQEEHKLKYQENIKNRNEELLKNKPKISKKYFPNRLKNGETKAELLTRSKHLLYKFSSKWTQQQQNRAKILFEEFPELLEAYRLINQFRKWYEPNNIKDKTWNFLTAETSLLDWIYKAENSKINEILNFKNTVENNEKYILNYHLNYKTNAISESINAKIKNATRNNNGTRNLDFFHFRLNLIL